MVRKTLAAMATTALLLAALAGQAFAHPPPTHLHCLTTPGGTHSVARGVTLHANHQTAFHNFHAVVHLGPFNPTTGSNPHPLTPDFTEPYTCPPSP